MESFALGIAFIVEGDTEKVFYTEYLIDICKKQDYLIDKIESSDGNDYVVTAKEKSILVKFHRVGTIGQMTNAGIWFNRACCLRHGALSWHVFLAYDTDSYNDPITKFHEGDWQILRSDLASAKSVTDLAAHADIEDVFLADYEGVLNYLGLPLKTEIPHKEKGKRIMQHLFRTVAPNRTYHAGNRARDLICSLDFEVLKEANIVPLKLIDEVLENALR